MKVHQCQKPYVVRTGKVPVRLRAGELLFEPKKGKFYRILAGVLREVDADDVHLDSFDSHEFEQSTAKPGVKRSVKRPKADTE